MKEMVRLFPSPTGPELGGWQGSHYMRVSDSSLSHYARRQLALALSDHSFVMQTILSHTPHINTFSGCLEILY